MAGEQNDSQGSGIVRGYAISFIFKGLLGFTLLLCAGLAVNNTAGQKDTFGPPYYVGAFVVGPLIMLCSILHLYICCRLYSMSAEELHGAKSFMQTCLKFDLVASVLTVMGSFMGVFICGIFGVAECDPSEWASHCNYVENMETNRTIAIVILLSILSSVVVTIVSCCFVQRQVVPFFGIQNNRFGSGGPLVIVGGNTAGQYPPPPGNTAGQTTYLPPENVTNDGGVPVFNHAGVGYTVPSYGTSGPNAAYSWQGATPGGTAAATSGGMGMSESVQQLQERNRLLQENIRLQREQLGLQQQLQHGPQIPPQPVAYPPPPSYDSCVTDPGQFQQLQEHTKQLEDEYQRQQQLLTEKPQDFSKMSPGFNSGTDVTPSAPPVD